MTITTLADLAKAFREKAQAAAVMTGSIPEAPAGLFARDDPDRIRRVTEYSTEARTWKEAADIVERALAGERAVGRGG